MHLNFDIFHKMALLPHIQDRVIQALMDLQMNNLLDVRQIADLLEYFHMPGHYIFCNDLLEQVSTAKDSAFILDYCFNLNGQVALYLIGQTGWDPTFSKKFYTQLRDWLVERPFEIVDKLLFVETDLLLDCLDRIPTVWKFYTITKLITHDSPVLRETNLLFAYLAEFIGFKLKDPRASSGTPGPSGPNGPLFEVNLIKRILNSPVDAGRFNVSFCNKFLLDVYIDIAFLEPEPDVIVQATKLAKVLMKFL